MIAVVYITINYLAIYFQIYLKFRRRKSFCDWATSSLLVLFKRPFSYDSETIRYSKYSNHRWNTNKVFKNKYNDWFKCMKYSHNCHNRIFHLHDWYSIFSKRIIRPCCTLISCRINNTRKPDCVLMDQNSGTSLFPLSLPKSLSQQK
jgi:hypothetical protein